MNINKMWEHSNNEMLPSGNKEQTIAAWNKVQTDEPQQHGVKRKEGDTKDYVVFIPFMWNF